MDANQLRQNWDQIKSQLQSKFPDATFTSAPSDVDTLVADIAQQSGRDRSEVQREVDSALSGMGNQGGQGRSQGQSQS